MKIIVILLLIFVSLGVTFILWAGTIGSTRSDGSSWLGDIIDEIRRKRNE
jgi:hypothetical protein